MAAAICKDRQSTEGGSQNGLPRGELEMPVKILDQHEPLTDAELDRLGDFLKSCTGGRGMNLEYAETVPQMRFAQNRA